MILKRWIPFRWLPASWGLIGEAYERAEAYYYFTDADLDRKLIQIEHREDATALAQANLDMDFKLGMIDEYRYDTAVNNLVHADEEDRRAEQLQIDVKHGRLSPYDADLKDARDNLDGLKLELALLEIEHRHGRLDKNTFSKQQATLRNEPWVAFVDSGFDPDQGLDGVYFEIDWNPQWVEFLRQHGYDGRTDELVIEEWFSAVCRSQAGASSMTSLGYDEE